MKFANFRIYVNKCTENFNVDAFEVRLKEETAGGIRFSAKELLYLVPEGEIVSIDGRVKMKMLNLDSIEISREDGAIYPYSGFHAMREFVRRKLKKEGVPATELEKINADLVEKELTEYVRFCRNDTWSGFGLYFRERFPESSKEKFGYNIGKMFQSYQNEFERPEVERECRWEYTTDFRTKERADGTSYVYPIKKKHMREVVPYGTKVIICTIGEVVRPYLNLE